MAQQGPQRMDRIAEMARERTRRLAADTHVRQRARDEAEAQLAQLKRYREEYSRRFQASGTAWQGHAMEDFRRFLDRLDRAIREQDTLARRAADAHAESEASVRESWRASCALGRLVDRAAEERQQHEVRRERRAEDELAAQRGQGSGLRKPSHD